VQEERQLLGSLLAHLPKIHCLMIRFREIGDRLVVNQGPTSTCGHNSRGMVLDTLGKEVDVGSLIQKGLKGTDPLIPKPDGGYWDHLKEMNDMLRGLRNHAETLEGVSNPLA